MFINFSYGFFFHTGSFTAVIKKSPLFQRTVGKDNKGTVMKNPIFLLLMFHTHRQKSWKTQNHFQMKHIW